VTDLSPLARLTSLTTLRLDNTLVADLSPLARLTELMTLGLDFTGVTQDEVARLKERLPRLVVSFINR
jgi:Leucine-rich repeat (LRR) protein